MHKNAICFGFEIKTKKLYDFLNNYDGEYVIQINLFDDLGLMPRSILDDYNKLNEYHFNIQYKYVIYVKNKLFKRLNNKTFDYIDEDEQNIQIFIDEIKNIICKIIDCLEIINKDLQTPLENIKEYHENIEGTIEIGIINKKNQKLSEFYNHIPLHKSIKNVDDLLNFHSNYALLFNC